MKANATYRTWLSFALMALFLLFLGGKGLHALAEYDHPPPRCVTGKDVAHVHDHENAHGHDCHLCLFQVPQLGDHRLPVYAEPVWIVAVEVPAFYRSSPSATATPPDQQRGPPAV